jgi:hypothetical protein
MRRSAAHGADRGVPLPIRLCRAATQVLHGDGGAVTLAYTEPARVTLCTTDAAALAIEQVQDVVGQGPGAEAFRSGHYTRLDLPGPGTGLDPRWPMLDGEGLTDLAPVTVHAVPLVHGDVVLGVLTVYRRGAETEIDLGEAEAVARLLIAALVAEGPAEPDPRNGPWSERAEVHRATGMVVFQLHVPEDEALALIRAHAYANEQSVERTARQVLSRGLTFTSSRDRGIEST